MCKHADTTFSSCAVFKTFTPRLTIPVTLIVFALQLIVCPLLVISIILSPWLTGKHATKLPFFLSIIIPFLPLPPLAWLLLDKFEIIELPPDVAVVPFVAIPPEPIVIL